VPTSEYLSANDDVDGDDSDDSNDDNDDDDDNNNNNNLSLAYHEGVWVIGDITPPLKVDTR
jgi:hypothetical protein